MDLFILCCFSLIILMFLGLGYYLIKTSFTNKLVRVVILTVISLAMIVAATPIFLLLLSILITILI